MKKLATLFVQHHYLELGHFVCQFCQQPNLHGETGKHAQKNQDSLADNQKHLLADMQNMLDNMECLKNLVVAKRESKDRLLKLSHVRQTM